jgi:hypothetical protein
MGIPAGREGQPFRGNAVVCVPCVGAYVLSYLYRSVNTANSVVFAWACVVH